MRMSCLGAALALLLVGCGEGGHGSAGRPLSDPSSLPGLVLWGKADGPLWQDAARTIPAEGPLDPVGAADDLGPLAAHLFQPDAALKPVVVPVAQNGLPGIYLNGAGDFLATTASVPYGEYTIFLVVKMPAMKELYLHSDGTNYDYINNPLDATDPFAIKIKRAGGSERSSYTAATDWAGSDARIIISTFDGTHAGHTLFRDGAFVSLAGGDTGNPGATTYEGTARLGAGIDTSTGQPALPCEGFLFEWAIYDHVLSVADTTSVADYLGRWFH